MPTEAKAEKIGIVASIEETRKELRKVHWPKKKELVNYTTIVIASVLVVSLLIYLIDSGLGFIVGKVVSN